MADSDPKVVTAQALNAISHQLPQLIAEVRKLVEVLQQLRENGLPVRQT